MTLTKWRRIWGERYPRNTLEVVEVGEPEQRAVLDDDRVDVCFVRLPVDRTGLHVIPLYEEVAVVIARKDHPISLFDTVTSQDLVDEAVIEPDHPDAIDLVAGGAGVLLVPQSIARTHSRRDLVHRPVSDAEPTTIGLAWPVDHPAELVDDFIGVVRGRTVNSSRSRAAESATRPAPEPTAKKPREKPKPTRGRSVRRSPRR